jgi:Glycosyl hydrolase family 95 catalytic domain/Glycoside hydrolase family 95, C-terminal domain
MRSKSNKISQRMDERQLMLFIRWSSSIRWGHSLLLFVATIGLFLENSFSQESTNSSLLQVDYRNLVSRADLQYEKTVSRSEAGIPLGNGRMGSLIWTSPTALKLQINRVDVFANNRATHSFNRRDLDYAHGCGFFDIDFVDFGADVFPKEGTKQHLSVYDGLLAVNGQGITAQIIAWHEQDVMAFQINDHRSQSTTINAKLRMLRPPEVYTKNHSAISTLHIRDGKIVLKQEFKEGDYFCSSAVVVGVVDREAMPRLSDATGGKVPITSSQKWRTPGLGQPTETEIRLAIKPGKGAFTILVASAASFDPKEDVIATALKQLESAKAKDFEALLPENKKWWHDYWSRAFVYLHSPDGIADEIEKHYTYFLYLMASSSRGKYALDFSGMLFSTLGDASAWGHQYWWYNTGLYYRGFFAANRLELMEPLFDTYRSMYSACSTAARQVWGSQGIYIPETVWFDGPETLPEDIAAEMRELYLVRKPWEMRSQRFREYAETQNPLTSIWNWKGVGKWIDGKWIFQDKGNGPFGNVLHMFESAPQIAYLYWKRYEYTLDKIWLRDRAYPMLKGVAEFYRNFPNLKKESDGKYHLHLVNNSEGIRGVRDAMGSMAAMYGIFPMLIKAAEILNVDADMLPVWQEFLDDLAPLPCSDHPDAPVRNAPGEPKFWISGLNPVLYGNVRQDHTPAMYFDLSTLETKEEDPELFQISLDTYNRSYPNGMNDSTRISVLSGSAVLAAKLGCADDVRHAIINQIRCQWPEGDFVDFDGTGRAGVLQNRMTLREGVNGIDAERLGNAAYALHEALCQSAPPGPGKDAVIHVFPAWPKDWDAAFTLLARGGFLVTSSLQKGAIEFVEMTSQLGGECRLRNPWPDHEVTLYRNGKNERNLKKSLLKFTTSKGEKIVLVSQGNSPAQFKRTILQ